MTTLGANGERLAAALADRYRIESEIGHGGAATVYLADDLRHGRRVAVKLLRPEVARALGPARFQREIAVAARLSHPHILALHEAGEVGGLLYYVMPWVEGESLRRRLEREGPLPVDQAVALAEQVAAALDHAHGRGVVHRDVKPENILLQGGQAVVADFGIALAATAAAGDRITGTGIVVGTPAYMSPEQAAGELALDGRSDLYSLACVLFELLTGGLPWRGTPAFLMARRFAEAPPSARALRPAVPRSVDAALRRALSPLPADRFATCGEFAIALRADLEPAPPSVAVLPFASLNGDAEGEFFADGITEDVIAQLAKIRSLKVIAAASVMQLKGQRRSVAEVAAALGVGAVLQGSVRRAGSRVRVVAQLDDAESGRRLWAETYDRDLTDLFELQSEVALQIAAALRAELSPGERSRIGRGPTSDLGAWQLYLQGRHLLSNYTDSSSFRAIDYFERALVRDPGFALAHAGLARAYIEVMIGQDTSALAPEESLSRARAAAARALAADATLGEAHAVLALIRFVGDRDWAGAEEEFRLALELSPGSADVHAHYGWLCTSLERYPEAERLTRRAQELDPLAYRTDVVSVLMRAGRYEDARREAERVIEFDPGFARGHSVHGWALIRLGEAEAGVAALRKAVALSEGSSLFLGQLGEALAETGQVGEAREILARLEQPGGGRPTSPYHRAYVYTGLGEHERALDLLEQAEREHEGGIYGVAGSFLFRSLRGHPRFTALLRRLNIEGAPAEAG
ncbi:MAG TPA: protein kinase [Gemmatimonadales bacterium]|nr:protein kinase [Gemmatimonadales bacterium]